MNIPVALKEALAAEEVVSNEETKDWVDPVRRDIGYVTISKKELRELQGTARAKREFHTVMAIEKILTRG